MKTITNKSNRALSVNLAPIPDPSKPDVATRPRSVMLLPFGSKSAETGIRQDQCDATDDDLLMHDVTGLLELGDIEITDQVVTPQPVKTRAMAESSALAVPSDKTGR